jgi:hypothetical protein
VVGRPGPVIGAAVVIDVAVVVVGDGGTDEAGGHHAGRGGGRINGLDGVAFRVVGRHAGGGGKGNAGCQDGFRNGEFHGNNGLNSKKRVPITTGLSENFGFRQEKFPGKSKFSFFVAAGFSAGILDFSMVFGMFWKAETEKIPVGPEENAFLRILF